MTRHSLVPLLAQLADAGTVFVAAILAFYLRFDAAVPVVLQQYHAYLFCILAGVLLNAFLATALGAYRNWRGAGLGDVLTPLLLAWGATALRRRLACINRFYQRWEHHTHSRQAP